MIEERVKKIMAEILSVDLAVINDDSSPDTIERWDSLRHMTLVLALEEEFGVKFHDDDVATMISYPLLLVTIKELAER